jgi:hypothetical protein
MYFSYDSCIITHATEVRVPARSIGFNPLVDLYRAPVMNPYKNCFWIGESTCISSSNMKFIIFLSIQYIRVIEAPAFAHLVVCLPTMFIKEVAISLVGRFLKVISLALLNNPYPNPNIPAII